MKTKTKIQLTIAILAGTILLSSNNALAGHAYAYLREQIRLMRDYLGVRITHNTYTDTMDDGSDEYITINLNRNQQYVIAGLCDESCNDLDLKLYNTSGYLLQSDTSLDKYAVVGVTPRVGGRYSLKIKMSDCYTSSCDYAIGVFSK
ncbi:MAG TPA: hypothetical protein V6D15_12285 [Oculatellaceae cyanobacterium]|jgi:hypothetical protein